MKKRLILSTMVVASSTMLSRVLGFTRDAVTAYFFGTGSGLDGFIVAFRIPNLLRRFVAEGTLTICFVPVYTEYLETKGEQEAKELAQKTLSILLVLLIFITVFGIVFSPQLIALFGYGFTDLSLIKSTVLLNRVMFPYIFLISLVAFCMGYLNSHRSFFAPAIAPVLLNLGMIFGVVILGKMLDFGLMGLAIGVILGGVMQLLLQIPYMLKHGFRLKISFDFKHPGIRKIGFMVLPAIISGAVYQMNLLINTILASMLPSGSVSYLYFSDRLTEIVMGVFVISIANVTLPEFSRFAARNDIESLKNSFHKALSSSLFFAIPAAVALFLAGEIIVEVLFMRGQFTRASVINTYQALYYSSIGIFSVTFYKLLVPLFYSMKDTRTPLVTAAIAFIINGIVGFLLMQTSLLHAGLSLSNVIAISVQVVLLLIFANKKWGSFYFGKLILPIMKLCLAATGMGVVIYFLGAYFNWQISFMGKIIRLSILIITAGTCYIALCFIFKVEELRFCLRLLQRITRKREV